MANPDQLIDAYMALRGQIARLVMRIVPPKEVEDIEKVRAVSAGAARGPTPACGRRCKEYQPQIVDLQAAGLPLDPAMDGHSLVSILRDR